MNGKRILGLGVMAVLLAALAAPALASTPGDRLVRIQLAFNTESGDESFVASGPGVCRSGSADEQDPWFVDAEDGFRIRMSKRLVCGDGSGWFRIVLSVGHTGKGQSSGGWAIVEGAGAYEAAVGGGTLTATGRYPHDAIGFDTMTGVIVR